ncbi:sugar ABC transporter ATP-binding protein [Arthrobacter sp. GCM10027362]|uniref:sugar ABC transporter ATP-binding protein n=1 Tax=Arthrobacter sp. GCM10027362 TaxID=3273379 RepID=UPI0036446E42
MRISKPILTAEAITKNYPGVQALKRVDLTLRAGEVTALMGENGAGKSTLIRIIAGLEQPTSGTLRIHGQEQVLKNATESQAAGVSVVSQEFRLVPQMTVAENIFLGNEITKGGLISRRRSTRMARKLFEELELSLNPNRIVGSLSVGDQQMVEITRALSRDFDVLVMDEPTAALNGEEVARLLALVERLKDRGKAILYVSHRLDEVFAVSERIAVFRDGASVADLVTAETTESQLVELMLGRELKQFEAQPANLAEHLGKDVRLRVDNLSCLRIQEPVSFDVRSGEILGVAGLVGSGRTEIMQSLFGMIPSNGNVSVDGRHIKLASPAAAIGAGLFMLSENRKSEGILPHLNVLENLVISAKPQQVRRSERWVTGKKQEVRTYERLKQELRIRVDRAQQLIGNLSGGNQQKVLFGRAVLANCGVLLLNEPTRGVDVGAKIEIYELIRKLAESGVAIVVSSSDTSELVTLAHRCLVIQHGRIRADLRDDEINEDQILAASVGTGNTEARHG